MTILESERHRCSLMLRGVQPDVSGDLDMRTVEIPGNPIPWSRAGSQGAHHRYTPKKLAAAERFAAAHLTALRDLEPGVAPLDGNLALAAIFYRDSARTVDADNLLKLILDAGTKAMLWRDDRQVTALVCAIELDRENPRTIVALGRHTSSLPRHLQRVK